MTLDRTKQLQLDLIALRAQEDRLVTEAVLRRDWDNAASHAARSQRFTISIHRMLTHGAPAAEVEQEWPPADPGA